MGKFHKGDVVIVRAVVDSGYDPPYYKAEKIHEPKIGISKRCLWREAVREEWKGLIVGFSFRQTGEGVSSRGGSFDDYDPGYLRADKYHYVYLIEPLGDDRWVKPSACLEEDLELENASGG